MNNLGLNFSYASIKTTFGKKTKRKLLLTMTLNYPQWKL